MNAIILESPRPANACVIWLHGLGADGHDFEPIVPELPSHLTSHTRFIFPHAPHRPITINGGMVMRGWYDIPVMDLTIQQDAEGIRDSERILHGYIAHEVERGIDSQRIILAGFSQGGAIVLHTGLRYRHQLCGILALSTYLPLVETVAAEIQPANQNTPIFMGHGEFDPVIPFYAAIRSKDNLETFGYQIEWHSYRMQHSICAEEIADLSQWLSRCLA
jgi:phospholipase/carboxylesterase